MRVAYVCADPGVPVFGTKGASVHIQEIVRAFRDRGDEVVVYATRRGDHPPADLADLRVIERRVARGDDRMRERAVADAAAELADAVVADGCDLVYERFSLFAAIGARVARSLPIRAVLEVNAPLIDEQRTHRVLVDENLAAATARTALTAADVVACVSAPVADWARAHGAIAPIVAPNGVNTARIRPSIVRPAEGEPFAVGFVGTLKPWHGVDVLIDAMGLLAASDHPSRLVVIGDGPAGADLRRHAAERGVDAVFHGAVAPDAVPGLLATLDVGVASYRAGDAYFSPLKVCEYLAAGVPVVASRLGQLPDLVQSGRTGLLTDPGDVQALAGALARLRDRPALRARMGAAARERAVAAHDWSRVLSGILASLPREDAA